MKIAISNIAWQGSEEAEAASLMQNLGIRGAEIAPTKIWPKPLEASEQEVRAYRQIWEKRGIAIVAMQSLLFGRPDLTLFGTHERRLEMLDYLKGILRLGGWLGVNVAVFGSPKNRQTGGRPAKEVAEIAAEFFLKAGQAARAHGLVLCIEPNPAAYECDFVRTSREGRELVKAVGHSGFGLHLDAAAMTLSHEPPARVEEAVGNICHFHASEAQLAPVGSGSVDHAGFSAALNKINYENWVSIEMKAAPSGNLPAVEKALRYVTATY